MMLKINTERLLTDLKELAAIGQTPMGGVNRTTFSAADMAGRDWFRQRVETAGLRYQADGAGNQSAILGDAERAILVGSHLDTVPDGGRFDGALGVLAALEAQRTLQEANITLPARIETISFTDEEGSLLSMLGSRAFAGALTPDELQPIHSTLENTPFTTTSMLAAACQNAAEYLAFFELHIEQGTRLEHANIDIGVVTNIVGIRHYWLIFDGQANHSGTTPMDQRADALWGASAFIQKAKTMVIEQFTPGVVNCGQLTIPSSAHNIVPGQVQLALEFRHGTPDQLNAMEHDLFALAQTMADQHGLMLSIETLGHVVPATLDEGIITAIETAADTLDLSHTRLMSFAGHDTQNISRIMPSAMFFVPSVKGYSHTPQEFTHDQDVINGANVILHTLLELIQRLPHANND